MDKDFNSLSISTWVIQIGGKIIDLCPTKAPTVSKQQFSTQPIHKILFPWSSMDKYFNYLLICTWIIQIGGKIINLQQKLHKQLQNVCGSFMCLWMYLFMIVFVLCVCVVGGV